MNPVKGKGERRWVREEEAEWKGGGKGKGGGKRAREKEREGKAEGEGKGEAGKVKKDSLRKVGRTDGLSGDFILCPMLYNVQCQTTRIQARVEWTLDSHGRTVQTNNLSKAHMTRDSISAAIWGISVQRTMK